MQLDPARLVLHGGDRVVQIDEVVALHLLQLAVVHLAGPQARQVVEHFQFSWDSKVA